MKNKALIITTIIFFLLVNSRYYWEGKLGLFAFPAFLILVAVYFGLLIALLCQVYLTIGRKFKEKNRLILILFLAAVLLLVFLKPFGLIDFDKFEGNDILIAQREGAANCLTTFKLKEGNKFTERSVCFGVTEIKGNFKLINDTIYFENVDHGRYHEEFYKFALIRPSVFIQDNKHFDLVRYKDLNDKAGNILWITKNDLYKVQNSRNTRF